MILRFRRAATLRRGIVAIAAVLLAGCSVLPRPRIPLPLPETRKPTPPPAGNVPAPPGDLAAIPDAVPRIEPRSRYGNPETYEVFGKRYRVLRSADGYVERGTASWYGPGFHAERTSSGEPYDMYAMTAAHKTLPIPAYARITNLQNGRSVVVRINDRGPFVGERIVDLSYTAAWKLDMLRTGTAPVELRVLDPRTEQLRSEQPRTAGTPMSTPSVPAPTTTPTASEPPAPAKALPISSRYLQAGSFGSAGNADALVAKLRSNGIGNASVREARIGERVVHRVLVGPIDDALEADDLIERLRLAGIPDARPAHE